MIVVARASGRTSGAAERAAEVPYGASSVRLLSGKGCAFANFVSWAAAERAIAALNGPGP